MPWKTIAVGALCLVAGLLIGRMIPGDGADQPSVGTELPEPRRLHRTAAARSGAGDAGRSQRSSAPGRDDGTLAAASGLADPAAHGPLVVVPASLLRNLSDKSGTSSLAQDLFSQDGQAEAALQITDQEKARIQQAWRETGEGIRKMEAEAASSEELPDGSVRITVPDMANAMGEIGSEFTTSVGDVLGDNRADALLAMKQVDTMFDRRKDEQTCTIRMDAIGNGEWRYHITLGSGNHATSQLVTRNIPPAIRHLTDKAGIQPGLPPVVEDPEE